MPHKTSFLSGVVEGFYGRPWSQPQRLRLFAWMRQWGMNTYLYAPKDDLKHRARWRHLYQPTETIDLRRLIRSAARKKITFTYGLGPGLDLRYADEGDERLLLARLAQLHDLGCRRFALLFDDIPLRLPAADRRRFRSLAAAQSALTNRVLGYLRTLPGAPELLFCPTVYCGQMAAPSVSSCAYLAELGRTLDPSVQVFWTGPQIVSEQISAGSLREVRRVLHRRPLLWDNLHANDYDLRRIYLGPYAGRSLAARAQLSGILTNPNCEFELNFVAIRTLALYVQARRRWDPLTAHRRALREWLPEWRLADGRGLSAEELRWLAEAFYLPHRHGAGAAAWLRAVQTAVGQSSAASEGTRVEVSRGCALARRLFDRSTTLCRRDLLYALYRHLWELKEEAELIEQYLAWRGTPTKGQPQFFSGMHRAGTYRGGLCADLQRCLPMTAEGGFSAVPATSARPGQAPS